MITNSGIWMRPGENCAPNERDIAVAMCRITRYAGALWVPLAAHSILVGEYAYQKTKDPQDFAFGLLHDAHETVTGEVTRHWKPKVMKESENELDARIFCFFNLSILDYLNRRDIIKEADEKALTAEATILGLKNWPHYFETVEGRPVPEISTAEKAKACLILNHWTTYTMIQGDSVEVNVLAGALEFVCRGRHDEARRELVKRFERLEVV